MEEKWEEISAGSLERRPELALLHARLLASTKRTIALEGGPGTGKTTLAAQFVRCYRDVFPAGVEYQVGYDAITRQRSIASNEGRALVVLDGLDEIPLSRREVLHLIDSWTAENPLLHALIVSRPLPELQAYESIHLGPMSDFDIERLIVSEAGSVGLPPASIVALVRGSPGLAKMMAQMVRARENWPSLVEALRSFRRPGLTDVHGRPLDSRSERARTFVSDVREINETIMQMVALNPDIIFQMPPRRFEEISAELFTRLGYDVTLTPVSNDGGKDLIIVKRTDLGTMLSFVECKRYLPGTPVGVEIVRSLNGVVEEGRATSGVVLTTSRFTRGAWSEQRKLAHRMSLKDYADFKDLLDRAMQPVRR